MNLEKLGLILFIKYVKQFETVKDHLLASLKELLMAMSSTLNITNQLTSHNFLLSRIHTLDKTFQKIDAVLKYSIKQIDGPKGKEQIANNHLKDNIVESIISVIDDEIESLNETPADNKELKIEALNTVKEVLYNHVQGEQDLVFNELIEIEKAANT